MKVLIEYLFKVLILRKVEQELIEVLEILENILISS